MTTASIGTRIGLRKITARIGAEVSGVSPSLELDPDTVTAIRAALNAPDSSLMAAGVAARTAGQITGTPT